MRLVKLISGRAITPLLIGAFAFMSIGAFGQKKDAATQTTVKGEVVDLSCYMDHGAKGEGHKMCAQTCIAKGLPAGLLTTDGQMYLLVEDHSNSKVYEKLSKYAADNVAITGVVNNKNGMKAISVEKIKRQ